MVILTDVNEGVVSVNRVDSLKMQFNRNNFENSGLTPLFMIDLGRNESKWKKKGGR